MSAALLLIVLQVPAQQPTDQIIRLVPYRRTREIAVRESRRAHQNDPILVWNEALLQAIRRDRTPPPKASRNLAMMHAAMFDAVNSIRRGYTPYLSEARAAEGASVECATAIAAHRVLFALYPDQTEHFDGLLDHCMGLENDGSPRAEGVRVGQYVAERMLAWRERDGNSRQLRYHPGSAPGDWQPTLPGYKAALLPQWGRLTPFTLRNPNQLRPAEPPRLDSPEYAAHFNEVKALGGLFSTTRTRDQTEIAHFWADGEGTVTPPGHWNRIAQTVSRQQGLSLEENARLFALLNLAMADAAITCWECKFRFSLWRPVQAIRQADRDNNPDTHPDPLWQPLLATPPFPSYTSGHSTFSGSAASVLACFFGTDRIAFSTTSDGLPGVTRSFNGFWAAAQEAGRSRIYGGIHYEFDNSEGLRIGHSLGKFVCESYMRPRP